MALRLVVTDMKLGLGSGSTAEWFVKLLGARVAEGLSITCAATSKRTAVLAQECGIPIRPLDEVGRLDLTIDGADEIDPLLNLIKGGGGCHLVEKIVAAASDDMVVIADDRKLVPVLGAFPLPLEIATYGWKTTAGMIDAVLADADVDGRIGARRGGNDPFMTDEGNYVLDYDLGRVADPVGLSQALNAIPGVVENGFFLGMASKAMIGAADGTAREVLPI
ncbi:UNVERIFIED_CONTAM: hypothetical protein GTU68_016493 [Idotea baltica]|nr:hypothetical protein [Idotea baltica]